MSSVIFRGRSLHTQENVNVPFSDLLAYFIWWSRLGFYKSGFIIMECLVWCLSQTIMNMMIRIKLSFLYRNQTERCFLCSWELTTYFKTRKRSAQSTLNKRGVTLLPFSWLIFRLAVQNNVTN